MVHSFYALGCERDCFLCSLIAQLVEQAAVNRFVVGSSPTRGAIFHFQPNVVSGRRAFLLNIQGFFLLQQSSEQRN